MKGLVLFGLSSLFSVSAFADCSSLSMQSLNSSYSFNTAASTTLSVLVQRPYNGGQCKYFITASKGSASTYTRRLRNWPSNNYPFQIYTDASSSIIFKAIPDITSSTQIITGNFDASPPYATHTQSYYASLVYPTTPVPAGYYSEMIQVRLYQGRYNDDYEFEDSFTQLFNYSVDHMLDLSLVASGATFNLGDTSELIDFGVMSSGLQRTFDALVSTNSGVKLKFSSANNGVLKHNTEPSTISYSTYVNSTLVNLSSSAGAPVLVASRSGMSPAGGFRFPVRFQLGTISGQSGGAYSDRITVTIESNL